MVTNRERLTWLGRLGAASLLLVGLRSLLSNQIEVERPITNLQSSHYFLPHQAAEEPNEGATEDSRKTRVLARRLKQCVASGLKFLLSTESSKMQYFSSYAQEMCRLIKNQAAPHTDLELDGICEVRGLPQFKDGLMKLNEFADKLKDQSAKFCRTRVEQVRVKLWKALEESQFRHDCNNRSLVMYNFENKCGFGCTAHLLLITFATAFAVNNTLVVNSKKWAYQSGGWEHLFLPTSNCTFERKRDVRVDSMIKSVLSSQYSVFRREFEVGEGKRYFPPAIPAWVVEELHDCRDNIQAWYTGQLALFLMRPKPELAQLSASVRRERLGDGPVDLIGLQIRMTDKLAGPHKEAVAQDLQSYLKYADALSEVSGTRFTDIWIATDNTSIPAQLGALSGKARLHSLASSKYLSKTISREDERYTADNLLGIYLDLLFLSRSRLMVGTMSSNVLRLAYELRVAGERLRDASWDCLSLDTDYHLFQRFSQDNLTILDEGTPREGTSYPPNTYRNRWVATGYAQLTDNSRKHKAYVPKFKTEPIYITF